MKGKHIEFAAGIVVGAVLFGGGAAWAVTEHLEVQRSTQTIYVDGEQVELEAYNINGANYVKLRDIGQAVDFEVYWDGEAVRVVSGQPYTGLPPVQSPAVEVPDYSQEANPAVFVGELSRENYNAIRDTIVNREAILSGQKVPVPLGEFTQYGDVEEAVIAIGGYPVYEVISQEEGGFVCNVKYPDAYKAAAEHTQGFIDGLGAMSDWEKVVAMVWYVADRITYSVEYPSLGKVLSQDEQIPGACMAYAYSFRFLCNQAGIPCILRQGGNHQWNMVYVDGQWWDVDVTAADSGDDTSFREYSTILHDSMEYRAEGHVDGEPEVTAFAQELLVPGSTR